MRLPHLGVLDLSRKNLRQRPYRSICLTAIVALLSFLLIVSGILAYGLANGMKSVSDRLGADVLIVPKGYDKKTEGALLRGEPSAFYISAEDSYKILKGSDFEKVSPQLFITSMDSDHCAFPVQLIGYDPETDFVIAPWIATATPKALELREIVAGANIQAEVGDELLFFNTKYRVVAKLHNTGMGFDTSVFFNMETAREALDEYLYYSGTEIPDKARAVSVLTADIKGGYTTEFQRSINDKYRNSGVEFVYTKNLIGTVSRNISTLLTYSVVILAILWLIAIGVLSIVFSVMLNERKREFAVYRALGSSRRWLTRMLLTETALVSLAGALLGAVSFLMLGYSFKGLFQREMDLPYVLPGSAMLLLLLLGGFLLSFVTGLLTSLASSVRIGKVAETALKPGGF